MRLTMTIDARDGRARATTVQLPRGSFRTPIFMPVGTYATVKGMLPEELAGIGAQVILANAYHLHVRPGDDVIARLGGLHRFMNWDRLLLTDSGGFQIFSLRARMRIDDRGVRFRDHLDGTERFVDPERAMAIQAALGSDIAMAFDHCPPSGAPAGAIAEAVDRTTLWARRSLAAPRPDHQARFGIVQGGLDLPLRRRHIGEICALPFDGFALGGLSVGEAPAAMYEVLDAVADELPAGRPRYLMGVGTPEDLVTAIGLGVDMFDCVLPTRHARTGALFTREGRVVISHARYRDDPAPPDPACTCATCAHYSRAYLAHLYRSREILYSRLATLHNLHFLLDLVARARDAITAGRYDAFRRDVLATRGSGPAGSG